MKKQNKNTLVPSKFAASATLLISATTLFATILALVSPNIKTITPLLQALYGPLGYTTTLTGAVLGTLYIAIDTFILTYLFAWIYNRIL